MLLPHDQRATSRHKGRALVLAGAASAMMILAAACGASPPNTILSSPQTSLSTPLAVSPPTSNEVSYASASSSFAGSSSSSSVLPKTGENPAWPVAGVGFVLVGAGVVASRRLGASRR